MSVLAPVQLIRSVPSVLSSNRERYEMVSFKQLRFKDNWILNSTRLVETVFHGSLYEI